MKKILAEDLNQIHIEEFAKEVKLMQNLRPHPNVVGLLGIVKSPLSIVTTYYVLGSLHHVLKANPLPLPLTIQVLIDIAAGMVKKKNTKLNGIKFTY